MNKDLDERLIPNGEYRDALNVEVSTADSSGVGVVKNILGNHRLDALVTGGFTCVGSVADEKTNKLYWFISSYSTDAIVEYSTESDQTSFVLVDKYAGTPKSVLKFSGRIITAINIVDNLLFWTDNVNDPKKINIEECKKGTTDINTHTQISFDKGSFDAMTIDLITGDVDANGDSIAIADNQTFPFNQVQDNGERVWYERKQLNALLGTEAVPPGFAFSYDVDAGSVEIEHQVKHYRGNEYLGLKNIIVFDDPNPLTSKGTYLHAVDDFTSLNVIHDAWQVDDVIFGNDITIDIEERHITVIKLKPLNAPSVKINHSESDNQPVSIPNLFETKLPRFAYRYKYKDGEFSAFSPFTHPVFNPKYPKDTSLSNTTNIFYNKDNAYTFEEPHNKAMVNSIHSVELTDFVTTHTPEDVIEIEILCKHEESPIIYSISTIKRTNVDWHRKSNYEGVGVDLGLNKSSIGTYESSGGITKGKYVISTENIYAALPANQLLRPWDNVPKKALAQEVTGNRIVYGNYVQNYDLGDDTEISVAYNDRSNSVNSFDTQGLRHVKSQRNYQVGVVYSDIYGRETPVFTSTAGAINIPWKDSNGNHNASRSLQLSASVINNFPEWVDSLKFFIKETSNTYYNLVMDRAWITKSTYELDDSKGNIWISFPSSDRNKVSEDDYIILKKKIGTGEEQIKAENKFKIIDIQNNAPEACRYQLVNYGQLSQASTTNATNALTEEIFTNEDKRIDKEVDTLTLSSDGWKTFSNSVSGLFGGIPLQEKESPATGPFRTTGLYISWRRLDANGQGVSSKKYKITGGVFDTNYTLKLATPITKIDADIAHFNGNSSSSNPQLNANLIVQIERKEIKDDENFSGKFFVKITKNQVTDLIENGNPVNTLDQFQVTSKISSCWYWQDDIPSLATQSAVYNGVSVTDYGLLNYHGFVADHTTDADDSIHDADNNSNVGDVDANSLEMKVTDYAEPWAGIKTVFGPTFFIDSMHMAAGQSEVSNYAKYSCITWSGCTSDEDESNEDSSWSYPPLKTWLTDFKDISGLEKKIKKGSKWFNNNLISTSPLVEPDKNLFNKRIDGWVGPLQNPSRNTPTSVDSINNNHINGLEGIVTTNTVHSVGPRRWFSGMTGDEKGVGSDSKIYSNDGEVGRHFMHLSFFAPGKDLHDNNWDNDNPTLFGNESWAANLKGIWGGGVFTGVRKNQKFGTTNAHQHLMMEGNHDENNNYKTLSPRPGVGVGFDMKYRELHDRQWDPTFNSEGDPDNKIRDFIRNLQPGAQFRFNKVSSVSINDQVNMASASTAAITMDTDTSTSGIVAGMLVSGVGIASGTTVSSVSGTTVNISATMSIVDDSILTFTIPENTDTEVYTIKKVSVKKLYNHTSWRKPYNRYLPTVGYMGRGSDVEEYWSVETVALQYLNKVDSVGVSTDNTRRDRLKNKIVDFGKAHNRRLCYIIELDKNPTEATFNPLQSSDDIMSADYGENNFCGIEFLDPVKDVLLSDLSKFPAIWELDPKKQEVDLDIYYEASGNIPVKINDKTNELFAPIGCKVEVLNSGDSGSSILKSWDGSKAILDPGFKKWDVNPEDVTSNNTNSDEIDYSGLSLKFTREDGSYTIAEINEYTPDGNNLTDFETEFDLNENIGENIMSGLSWYNCFSFGNGIESNRIRDDFNTIFIANGVKASTITQGIYEEEHRPHSLIYSGIYNSNSGVNDLNQFLMAEKITKDLNPTFGSIQKLFQRRISLIAFCEDRVISIVSNKDTIFNADGNPQLIASNRVLGDATPFSGNYGISTNPESFAKESFRAYFTDKQRGAVLRLSKDGLTPISKAGMHDWFRDNLTEYNSLIGTYDSYKEDYNLTLSNNSFSQNLIFDSYVEAGGDPVSVTDATNRILNAAPTGDNFIPIYNIYDVIDTTQVVDGNPNPFNWDAFLPTSYALTSSATVTNHAAIPVGALQAHVAEISNIVPIPATTQQYDKYTDLPNSGTTYGGTFWNVDDFRTLSWDNTLPLPDQKDLTPIRCTMTPVYPTLPDMLEGGNPGGTMVGLSQGTDPINNWGNANLTRDICYPLRWYPGASMIVSAQNHQISRMITRAGTYDWSNSTTSGGTDYLFYDNDWVQSANWAELESQHSLENCIVFDRCLTDTYLELKDFGAPDDNGDLTGDLNSAMRGHLEDRALGPVTPAAFAAEAANLKHSSFYNGDELIIEFEVIHFNTMCGGSWGYNPTNTLKSLYGRNYVTIELSFLDGANLIDNDAIVGKNTSEVSFGSYAPYNYYEYAHSNGWAGYTEPNDAHKSVFFIGPLSSAASPASYGNQGTLETYHDPLNGFFDTTDSITHDAIWAQNSVVTFVRTFDDPSLSAYKASTTTLGAASFIKKYTCLLKFQDPNQTDNSVPISAVKVVDDFRIQIRNTSTHGGGTWYHASFSDRLKYPLWAIKSFKIRKAKGIVSDDYAGFDSGTISEIEVLPVPPVEIPAWSEIIYNNFTLPTTTWTITEDVVLGTNTTPTVVVHHAQTDNVFGSSRSAVLQTGYTYNAADPLSQGTPIDYVIPEDFTISGNINDGYTSADDFVSNGGVIGAPQVGGYSFDRVNAPNNSYSGNDIFVDNSYISITSGDTDSITDMHHSLAGNPFEVSKWYLVDVEFETVDNFPSASNWDGALAVYGVSSTGDGIGNSGATISGSGIGTYAITGGVVNCRLQQVNRTEYGSSGVGDNKLVLRGIFKVANDSYLNTNSQLDNFTLRVIGGTGELKIEKIIVKKLSTSSPSYGYVNDWSNSEGVSADTHAFRNNTMYISNNRFCWQVPAIANYHKNTWSQVIANPENIYKTTWNLKFTVYPNPITNNFSGSLSGVVGIDNDGFRAMAFTGVQQEGNYLVEFELVDAPNIASWKIYREDIGTTVNNSSLEYTDATLYDDVSSIGYFAANAGNQIQFFNNNTSLVDQEYSIQDLDLIPLEQSIFTGSIGSWNIVGFPQALGYIYLDNEENRFEFDDCPITQDQVQFINLNQQLAQNVKQNEQYKITFTHGITEGEIAVYYYNNENYGFKITGIDSNSPTEFEQIVTIGEDIWTPTQGIIKGMDYGPGGMNIDADYKNTFVVRANVAFGDEVSGYIDNLSMVKVYISADTPDKTVTFNEAVNGWSSFKSFVPENGVSLSKKYFTFKSGGLWQHYIPKLGGATSYIDNDGFTVKYKAEQADNYSIFYNSASPCSIKGVLNQSPSVVKAFNTINYEGTQTYINKPNNASQVTPNNAIAWGSNSNILGWKCVEIKTDLDVGSVIEFIKKEGKWFNYIKGVNNNQSLDTGRFSVQGIGVAEEVQGMTFVAPALGDGIDLGGGDGLGDNGGGNGGGGNGGGGNGGGGGY